MRQGIKARRTRNEGRVRALEAMRMERSQRRELQGKAKLQLDEVNRSGKLVFETEGLGLDFGNRTLFKGLESASAAWRQDCAGRPQWLRQIDPDQAVAGSA